MNYQWISDEYYQWISDEYYWWISVDGDGDTFSPVATKDVICTPGPVAPVAFVLVCEADADTDTTADDTAPIAPIAIVTVVDFGDDVDDGDVNVDDDDGDTDDDDDDGDTDDDVNATSTVAIICAAGPVATVAFVFVCDDPVNTGTVVHDGDGASYGDIGDGVGNDIVVSALAAPNVK